MAVQLGIWSCGQVPRYVPINIPFFLCQVLKLLIDHVDNTSEESWKGYFYAILLFVASVFNTITFQHYVLPLIQVATQVRSSLISAILRKTLRLSNAARQKFTTGEITNYVSVDTQRLLDNIPGNPVGSSVAGFLGYALSVHGAWHCSHGWPSWPCPINACQCCWQQNRRKDSRETTEGQGQQDKGQLQIWNR